VVLHVFEHACNLINEHRDVLSLVTKQIGNGPFNLVIEDDINFVKHCKIDSPILMEDKVLRVGNIIIHMPGVGFWTARPDWERARTKQAAILSQIAQLPITIDQPSIPSSLLSDFSSSVASADLPSIVAAAKKLAGLGQGLTPSGDDFILGALYATWIIHPPKIARTLATEVSNVAAPLTTSLSASWLRSAARGEAGILWHTFFNALLSADPIQIHKSITSILSVGATSGADALSGFMGSLSYDGVDVQHG